MKIFSIFLIAIFLFAGVQAQRVTRVTKDSAVNAQTRYLTFSNTLSSMKSISLVATRVSGYVKGSAIIERRVDTLPTTSVSTWKAVGDTFTFTNAADQTFIWPFTNQDGKDYRIKITTIDSTQKLYLYGAMLRR